MCVRWVSCVLNVCTASELCAQCVCARRVCYMSTCNCVSTCKWNLHANIYVQIICNCYNNNNIWSCIKLTYKLYINLLLLDLVLVSTVTSFVGLLGMGWCVWVYLEYVSDFIQRCMSVYIQGVCVLHSMCVFGLWVIQLGWVRMCFINI